MQDLYYFLRLGPDREVWCKTCIIFWGWARIMTGYGTVHMPRIHIWQSQVGLPKLAISRRYYKTFFPNYFRKSRPPIGPLEFRPGAKSYFMWSSTYQLFQKRIGLETFFFLIFRFQDIKKFRTSENSTKPLFHFKPSGIHFTETLFQTSTPCRVPSR